MLRGRFTHAVVCVVALWLPPILDAAPVTGQWDLLVLPLQHDGTFPVTHPGYRLIEQEIEQQLSLNYAVYDKDAIGLDLDCAQEDCSTSAQQDILDRVRDVNRKRRNTGLPPIDLVWLFEINRHEPIKSAAVVRFRFSVTGSLVSLDNGRTIGTFPGSRQEIPVRVDSRLQSPGWQAEQIIDYGKDAIAALMLKLSDYRRERDFIITLEGFLPAELSAFQRELVRRPEHQARNLEALGSMQIDRQLLHSVAARSFRLRTAMDRRRLEQSVLQILDRIGAGAPLSILGSGPFEIAFERGKIPYFWLYVGGLVALVLVLLAASVWARYRHHDRELGYRYANARATSGLAYLSNDVRWLPRRRRWDAWGEEWNRQAVESGRLLESARADIDMARFDSAEQRLSQALDVDADNSAARELAKQLPDLQDGHHLLEDARATYEGDPTGALAMIDRAVSLNPGLAEAAGQFRQTVEQLEDAEAFDRLMDRINASITEGRPYAALADIDAALMARSGDGGFVTQREHLQDRRRAALAMVDVATGSLTGQGAANGLCLLRSQEVSIGRRSSGAQDASGDAILLGYKRLSRNSKQTRIRRTTEGITVQDLGSTNGTRVDGKLLEPGEPVTLKGEAALSLATGREETSTAVCQLRLRPDRDSLRTFTIEVDQAPLRLIDWTAVSEAWPGVDADLSCKWAVVGDVLSLGVHEGTVDAGCTRADAAMAQLVYDDGWYVQPLHTGPESGVAIDGATVVDRVPLATGVRLELAGVALSFVDAGATVADV